MVMLAGLMCQIIILNMLYSSGTFCIAPCVTHRVHLQPSSLSSFKKNLAFFDKTINPCKRLQPPQYNILSVNVTFLSLQKGSLLHTLKPRVDPESMECYVSGLVSDETISNRGLGYEWNSPTKGRSFFIMNDQNRQKPVPTIHDLILCRFATF